MNNLKFWKAFPKSDQITFLTILGIIIGLIAVLFVVNIINLELVLSWTNQTESVNIPVVVDSFNYLLYDFNIEIDQYLVFNEFNASELNIKPWSWNFYLVFYGLGLSIIGAAVSTIEKRLFYFIGITLFSFLLLALRMDGLLIFGSKNPYVIGVFIIPYLGLSYYLHAFADHVGIFKRLLIFTLSTSLLGYFALSSSTLNNPSMHLANYATIGASLLSLIYILSISHDNIWLIVKLTSGANAINPKTNFYNYIILTLLYLVFPTLLFLKHQGHIEANLSYLNPLYLLIASTLVSIWAVRKREILYKGFFRYDPVVKYLHLGLILITFSVLIVSYLTYNASYIIFFEKIIIFSHLAFGCIFFVYVGLNFAIPYMENLKIDRVIYEGNKLPYISVGFTSLAMMFLIMWSNHHIQYRQWISGTFNLIAETEKANGNELLSNQLYKTSLSYHNHNFKASYTLGQEALTSGNRILSEHLFNSAAQFSEVKSPMTYIKLTNEYTSENQEFTKIWTLEDAHKHFPSSGEILTNQGVSLMNSGFLDSSLTCFKDATSLLSDDASKANIIGLLAKRTSDDNQISELLRQNSNSNHYESIINLSALYNLEERENKIPFKSINLNHDNLSTKHLAYIHNYTLNTNIKANDNLREELEKLEKELVNTSFVADIHFLLGYYTFYNENKLASLNYFNSVMTDCELSLIPYYGLAIGQILMSSEYTDLAKPFLQKSIEAQRFNQINDAPLLGAFNAITTGDTSLFVFSKGVVGRYDSLNQSILSEIRPILYEKKSENLIQYSDRQKVMFAKARPDLIFVSDHNSILESFEDLNLKGLFIAYAMDWFTKYNVPELNEYYWERLPKESIEEYTVNELNYQYLNMLSLAYRYNEVVDRIPTMAFNSNREKDIYFLSARALQALNKTDNAKQNYLNALKIDGLNPELLNTASLFFKKNNDKEKAYQLISTAVELYPNHIDINKNFSLQALENGQYNIAEQVLEDIKELLTKDEFTSFKKQFEQLEAELNNIKEDW